MANYADLIDRTDAEALTQETVAPEIIRALPATSAVWALARHVTMSKKTHRMPVQDALTQAYWVGGDTGLKQTTEMIWNNKFLVAEEQAAIVPFALNVADDSDYDLVLETLPDLKRAVGALLDATALFSFNKPASFPEGIVVQAAAAGQTNIRGAVVGQDFAADVGDTMSLVEMLGHPITGFAAYPGVKGVLRNLRNSNGDPIYTNLQSGVYDQLHGENMAYINNGSWNASEALLIAGNWANAIVGVRKDITTEIFTSGVISDDDGKVILNLMQQDSGAIRLTTRLAFQTSDPISPLTGARELPFSVLRPAGYVEA